MNTGVTSIINKIAYTMLLAIFVSGCEYKMDQNQSGVFGDGPGTGNSYSSTVINNAGNSGGSGNGGSIGSSLVILTGDGQTGIINSAFSTLRVKALSASSLPLPATDITFSLAGSGTLSAPPLTGIVQTDANGVASVNYTAGALAGAVTVTASMAGATPINFNLTVVTLSAYSIQTVSGDNQSTALNYPMTALALPLMVQVRAQDGSVAGNIDVTFAIASGNGALNGGSTYTVKTNSLGYASSTLTPGTVAGSNTVKAYLAGYPSLFTNFIASTTVPTTAPISLSLSKIELSQYSSQANGTNLVSVIVTLKDIYGNAITANDPNLMVAYAPGNLGTWSNNASMNYVGSGVFSNSFRVGSTAGTATFTAYIGVATLTSGNANLVLNTGLTTAAGGATLEISRGNNQTIGFGQTAPVPLEVVALDSLGSPIPNSVVNFTILTGFGSLSPASATTNQEGKAFVTLTAGIQVGPGTIRATSAQGSANFVFAVQDLTNYTISAVAGSNPQSGYLNRTLNPLTVVVRNASSNPVAGQSVRFEYQAGSNRGKFTNDLDYFDGVTDSNGRVSASYILGTVPGLYNVRAYIPTQSSIQTVFNLTATVDPASPISLTQTAVTLSNSVVVADGFSTSTAQVTLKDMYGNTIPNSSAAVRVTAALANLGLWVGGGTSTALTFTALTGASTGTYQGVFNVGNIAGSLNFSATIASPITIPVLLTSALQSASATLTINANANPSADRTTITSLSNTLTADGADFTTLVATLFDASGNAISAPGHTVVISTNLGTLVEGTTMLYHAATGSYRTTFRAPTTSGTAADITLNTVNGIPVVGLPANTIARITLNPGLPSLTKSYLTVTPIGNVIVTRGTRTLTAYLRDNFNNPIPTLSSGCGVANSILISKNYLSGGTGTMSAVIPGAAGTCTATVTAPAACSGGPCFEIVLATINGQPITGSGAKLQYLDTAFTVDASKSIYTLSSLSLQTSSTFFLTITPRNAASAPSQVGGLGSQISVTLTNGTLSPIEDLNNGSYKITILAPPVSGQGLLTVKYAGTTLSYQPAQGAPVPGPTQLNYQGSGATATSTFTFAIDTISGPTSTQVFLNLKDSSGNDVTDITLAPPASAITFTSSNVNTLLAGSVTMTGGSGAPIKYEQTISRNAAPTIGFETTTVTAKLNGITPFALSGTLNITPPNLKGVTIDCTNILNYRTLPVYVAGGTLTINSRVNGVMDTSSQCFGLGANAFVFSDMVIGDAGVLTHSAGNASTIYGLDIESTGRVEVFATGVIHADQKGYATGRGVVVNATTMPTNMTNSAAIQGAVGSHGGLATSQPINAIYDSVSDPIFAGIGGIGDPGAGIIRINAVNFINNGKVTANTTQHGAPGSVKLTATGTVSGLGLFQARSTSVVINPTPRCAGGGRIAIHGALASEVKLNQFATHPASCPTSLAANNGTLYFTHSFTGQVTIPFSMWLTSVSGQNNSVIPLSNATELILPNGTTLISDSPLLLSKLDLQAGATLTHTPWSPSYNTPKIDITTLQTMTISGNVNANGLGLTGIQNQSGAGQARFINTATDNSGRPLVCTGGITGICVVPCNTVGQTNFGGNHYRAGGLNNTTGSTWGDANAPLTYGGSGCSAAATIPGTGGGIIKLFSNANIIIDGAISANGQTTSTFWTNGNTGGGAGGSIYISAKGSLSGQGALNANGSKGDGWSTAGPAGGGAGGLIRLEKNTGAGISSISVIGGSPYLSGGTALGGVSSTGFPTW